MSVDTDLSAALTERLTAVIDNAVAQLPRGMSRDDYQRSCGMIEAWRQIRDTLIPELTEEIQKR